MTNGKSAGSGTYRAVECLTCHRIKWYSPAVAARRKYCDHICYVARPSVTLAQAIINMLGGRNALSILLKVEDNTVKSWLQNGIPGRYHIDILRLARERGHAGAITLTKLQRTQAAGRAHRLEDHR